jgi:acetylornithine/N-succinyldiaminopimelate aminotransferase
MRDVPFTSPAALLGREGSKICAALEAAREFLQANSPAALLAQVGRTLEGIPPAVHLDKGVMQRSFRGDPARPADDLLTGQGVFYVTEERKLFLDCTAGHYQMTWGYNHPELSAAVIEALQAGIVWDDHSNIPGDAVKRLAARLVEVAGGGQAGPEKGTGTSCRNGPSGASHKGCQSPFPDEALNTVLLGVCTGSVAAGGALKLVLKHHEAVRPGTQPVLIAIAGNYHGTDFLAQRLRGMWPQYFTGLEVVQVEPNDTAALERAFQTHCGRVAAFFAEPVLMNREAILLDHEFLRAARKLCDEADACMVLDEIQTGFWCPEVFMFRQYGIVPDILVAGKGMTAGFHPLSALIYRRKYDRLEQYDAISTNGNAPLASLVGLCCLELLQRDRQRIDALGRRYFQRLQELPEAHPKRVAAIHGKGLLAGVKFHTVNDAVAFHRRALERGLWVRAQTYHPGHSTVLTKPALAADERVVDFVVDAFLEILERLY